MLTQGAPEIIIINSNYRYAFSQTLSLKASARETGGGVDQYNIDSTMFRLLNYYGKNYGHEKIVEGRGVHGESKRLPAAPISFLPTGQMPDVMLLGVVKIRKNTLLVVLKCQRGRCRSRLGLAFGG